MSITEAENAGIDPSKRWRYVRIDPHGKANMGPPSEHAEWCRFESVELANGDSVGVMAPWTYPQPFENTTVDDLKAAQKAIANGGPWRANPQAAMWAGYAIAQALGLDASSKSDRHRVSKLLAVWIANGAFKIVTSKGRSRHDVAFIEVARGVD